MGVNLELRAVHYFPIGKQRPESCPSTPNIPDREISLALSPVVPDNFPNGKLSNHDIHSISSTTRACTACRSQAARADPAPVGTGGWGGCALHCQIGRAHV